MKKLLAYLLIAPLAQILIVWQVGQVGFWALVALLAVAWGFLRKSRRV